MNSEFKTLNGKKLIVLPEKLLRTKTTKSRVKLDIFCGDKPHGTSFNNLVFVKMTTERSKVKII